MKSWDLLLTLGLALLTITIVTGIESPVPYSVNIFLIPPIVQAKCAIGRFWYPDMVCSVCLCLTGGLSRCGPKPGCDPNDFTTTTQAPDDVAVHPGGAIIGVAGNATNATVAAITDHAPPITLPPNSTTAAPATVTTAPGAPAGGATPGNTPGQRLAARRSRSPRFSTFQRS